jgi:hypothetical protein
VRARALLAIGLLAGGLGAWLEARHRPPGGGPRGPVALRRGEGGVACVVDGEPALVRGVTWGGGPYDEARWRADFAAVRRLGANAIRIWAVDEDTPRLLDMAAENGLAVLVGIWLRHGRPGAEADDRFDWLRDEAGREAQRRDALAAVRALKGHRAVLAWALGNEVLFNTATDEEKTAFARFLGGLAAEVKAIDPDHAVTSVTAWVHDLGLLEAQCPALDFYGINSYGWKDTSRIEPELARLGVAKPYLVTEFGPCGEWEVEPDARGVKLDPPEEEKCDFLRRGWRDLVAARRGRCLGGFVFHFGNDRSHTGLWLGLRAEGLLRPSFFAARDAFQGDAGGGDPAGAPPRIESFALAREAAEPGAWVPARLAAVGGRLGVEFAYNQRAGPRFFADWTHPLASRRAGSGYEVEMPENVTAGAIKVYALATDGASLAVATTSIGVAGRAGAAAPCGVKEALPFVLYAEGDEAHGFSPSGRMGDLAVLEVDPRCREAARTGRFGLRVRFGAAGGWAGVAWQRPAGDWGREPWAADLRGARRITLWARGSRGGEVVSARVGLVGPDEPFPDSARLAPVEWKLGPGWSRHEIDLGGADLRHVKTPLALFFEARGAPLAFDLDDIAIE